MSTTPDEDSDRGRGAVTDPAGYYTDPTAIQADKTLSKQQKRRYLTALHGDLETASEPDPALLEDVESVQETLGQDQRGPDADTSGRGGQAEAPAGG